MSDLLARLADWHAMEILFVLGVVLVLIDYWFPVDYPAFIGYLCFAGGMLWAVPLGPWGSVLAAVGLFVVLLVLHRVWFHRFLTNATDRKDADAGGIAAG